MSEKSLEDFFAKKDKSKKNKSKGKTKFTTTDEIAKKLHEGEKKAVKKEKKKEEKKVEKLPTDTVEDQPKTAAYQVAGEEEWNEFEDPNDKDYSGLKVQSLQISAEPEEPEGEEEEGEEIDENGELIKTKGSGQSGPWKKSNNPQSQASPSDPEGPPRPPPEEKKPEPPKPAPSTAGKYVPPSRRFAAAASSERRDTPQRRNPRGGKNVPQIQSDLEFPSLAASSDIAKYSDKNSEKNFQEVRKGGYATDNPAGSRPRLELENRYAALGN